MLVEQVSMKSIETITSINFFYKLDCLLAEQTCIPNILNSDTCHLIIMDSNNPKLLSTNHIWKILFAAFLMALLVSSTALLVYRNYNNDIFPFTNSEIKGEDGFEEIQWQFDSGLSLSNQLTEEINKLMFVKIDVGYRIENPTGGFHLHSIEGINYNVTDIEAWLYDDEVIGEEGKIGEIQRPVAGSWRMWIHSSIENRSVDPENCPDDLFCGPPMIVLNETQNMNDLYASFTQDIANIGNFLNVTSNGTEEVAFLNSKIEVLYWQITHVYRDGSFMKFYIFDDIMIIRYTPLEIYLINEGGVTVGPSYNNANSVSFKVTIKGAIMPNYINGINSLLTTIKNP